jgi:hypothetical protein
MITCVNRQIQSRPTTPLLLPLQCFTCNWFSPFNPHLIRIDQCGYLPYFSFFGNYLSLNSLPNSIII